MHKVLVIGGAGFLGYHLCNYLLKKKKYKIDIIDNLSKGKKDHSLKELIKDPKIEFFHHDVSLKKIQLKERNYSYIFQLAAILGVDNVIKNPSNVLIKNFNIQINSLEFAKKQKKLNRFIFSSTSEIHIGNEKLKELNFPTKENFKIILDDIKNPRTTYSLSKIYGEALLLHSSLPYSIIRPHNLYGQRMGNLHVIPQLFTKIDKLKNNEVLPLHSQNHKRCFCYISDAIEQIYTIMNNKKAVNTIFNIGNNLEEISIKQLALIIGNIVNKKFVIKIKEFNNSSPKKRIPSLTKVNKLKKTKFKYTNIQDGCLKYYEWKISN